MNQILKYKWDNWEPMLILDGGISLPLFDKEISMKLGKKKCTGYFKNGKRRKCPENALTTFDYMCEKCQKEDDYFFCIRCSGECLNPKKRNQCTKNIYSIYLAAFDSLIKIGISIDFRLLQRLVEQGADFGTKLVTLDDGKTARKMEQKIRRELGIVDKVRGEKKSEKIFGNPNNSVAALNKKIQELKNNGMPLINPEIYDLRGYYRLGYVSKFPKLMQINEGMEIEGKVVAAKGNIVVIKNQEWHMLNAHRLVGREVELR